MARYIDQDASEVFRAVVVVEYESPDFDKSVQVFGPFTTRGVATAAINRVKREANRHNSRLYPYRYPEADMKVEGYVERAQITWERIDGR